MSDPKTNRSSSRLAAVQALYEYEFGDKTIDAIAREFLSGETGSEVIRENEFTQEETFVPVIPAEPTLFSTILSSYADNRDEINKLVDSSFNEEWPAEHVEMTLKAILRAGTAELTGTSTPEAIIITEYLDVTKSFYDGPEIKVVNGILDKIAKKLRGKAQ